MREVSRNKANILIIVLAFFGAGASAQTFNSAGQPIIVPSQSSVYNQNSVFLPTPPVAHGQDIVRSADGSSCQSSVSNGGPYLDVGMIGSQDVFNRETAAIYGRIVVPLGQRPERIDCTKLYQLEIQRMRVELDLLRMGFPVGDIDAVLSNYAEADAVASASKVAPAMLQLQEFVDAESITRSRRRPPPEIDEK